MCSFDIGFESQPASEAICKRCVCGMVWSQIWRKLARVVQELLPSNWLRSATIIKFEQHGMECLLQSLQISDAAGATS